MPQERSRKCILHHFQFASFAFCDLIRISDYKMHQCIQSLMHVAVHTLEDHLLDFAKSVVKPIRPVLFCRESSIPSKFQFFQFFNLPYLSEAICRKKQHHQYIFSSRWFSMAFKSCARLHPCIKARSCAD